VVSRTTLLWGAALGAGGCGATLGTEHFVIQNSSSAPREALIALGAELEEERLRVSRFLRREVPTRIVVWVEDGNRVANVAGGRLNLYAQHGQIYTGAAAHELVHLTTGYTALPFLEEGLAVYVSEELDPHLTNLFPQVGQPVDGWVELFRRRDTLIPLEVAFRTQRFDWNLDGSPRDAEAWQTYVEAGSFVRFVVESKGWEAFWRLHRHQSLQTSLERSPAQLQQEWLESVSSRRKYTMPCRMALPQNRGRYRAWCERAEPGQ
jgi:hypothetical protein